MSEGPQAGREGGGARTGTAVRAKGRRRVQDILDAGLRVLVDDGHGALSLRRVAEATDMRLSNLQYYFPTREALLSALMSREFDRHALSLEARVAAAGPDAARRLEAALDYLLADQQDPASCALVWDLWAMAARDPVAAEIMDRYYQRFIAGTAALLRDVGFDGDEGLVNRRAALIVALLEGASLLRGAGKPARPNLAGLDDDLRRLCLNLARVGLADRGPAAAG